MLTNIIEIFTIKTNIINYPDRAGARKENNYL